MARKMRSVFSTANQGKLAGTLFNNALVYAERSARQQRKDKEKAERARAREQAQIEKAQRKAAAKAERDREKRTKEKALYEARSDKMTARLVLELENNGISLLSHNFLNELVDTATKAGLAINQLSSQLIRPRLEKLKRQAVESHLRVSLGLGPSSRELSELVSDFQESQDAEGILEDARYQKLYVVYGREVFRKRYFCLSYYDDSRNFEAWYSNLENPQQINAKTGEEREKLSPEVIFEYREEKPSLLSVEDWEENYWTNFGQRHFSSFIPQDFLEFRKIAEDENIGDDQEKFWELEAKYRDRCVLANIESNLLADDSELLLNHLDRTEGIIDSKVLVEYEAAKTRRQQFVSGLNEGLFDRPENRLREFEFAEILGVEGGSDSLRYLEDYYNPSTDQLEKLALD